MNESKSVENTHHIVNYTVRIVIILSRFEYS